MIPSALEVANALYGCWRLARSDPSAVSYFNDSVAGFWRSFFAAVIILPGHVLLLALRPEPIPEDAAIVRFVAVEAITYVIGWVAFPLIMARLCEAIDRRDQFILFIVAFNWSQILQLAIYLPVLLLRRVDVAPSHLAGILTVAAIVAILVYSWYIARTTLKVGGMTAVGVIALHEIVALFILQISKSLI